MYPPSDFLSELRDHVVVFDGAMGTALQSLELGLDDYEGKEGCSEVLVETRPQVVAGIHASFLEVGCQVIETNSFGANRVVFAEYDMACRVHEFNVAAAKLARGVAADFNDSQRYVAGSIGPGTKLPSLGHIGPDELREMYEEQIDGLVEGGVDLLLVETCQDILQAKCALVAVQDVFARRRVRLPVIVQVTIETTGTMLVGTEIGAALTVLRTFDVVDAVGMNCATGPAEMNDAIRHLTAACPLPVSCLPNAGLPENIGGRTVYPLSPDELAHWLERYVRQYGVNIVGGCCGTTPEHLRCVVDAVAGLAPTPREVVTVGEAASCYSSVQIRQDPPPTIIGEELNTTTSRTTFRELVQRRRHDEIVSMARRIVDEGSHMLDLCVAIVGEDEETYMKEVVEALATRVTAPLLIDSTEIPVVEEALKRIPGKAIVNSVNLEDGEERVQRVCALCKRYGAGVIALTIDEEGMALTADRKVAIAERLHDLITRQCGLAEEDVIFDALVLPVSTGQEEYRTAARETCEAVRRIKDKFPQCATVLGVSNVSFGLSVEARRILNSVFLHETVQAGLDMAIVNFARIYPLFRIPDSLRVLAEKLLNCDTSDGDPLQNYIAAFETEQDLGLVEQEQDAAGLSLDERLHRCIVNGEKQLAIGGEQVSLAEMLDEALQSRSALDIINHTLLAAMQTVGDLFGSGRMQLPSVLDSATVMKAAVKHLEPHMEKADGAVRGRIVLATVKGDVHDIGKNLVDIILTNNGYQVHNLGIKQPSDAILSAAAEHDADAIGLSGLLVKSTIEMRYVVEDMARQGIDIPVLCGGAALTRRYVERDLRGLSVGPVFYGQDAFEGLRTMDSLLNPETRAQTVHEGCTVSNEERPAVARPRPRAVATARSVEDVPVEMIPSPPFWGTRVVVDVDLREVFGLINETALFKNQWQVRGLKRAEYQRQVEQKYRPELLRLQEQVLAEGLFEPRVLYGYFACQAEGDDLVLFPDPTAAESLGRFTFPRQTTGQGTCLADYFATSEAPRRDVVALTLVTIGSQATAAAHDLYESDRYTEYLYFHGFSVETAEALAEWAHRMVRQELGIAGDESDDPGQILRQNYRGKRYSFGYGACPNLADQELLLQLLGGGDRIGVRLTENYQLDPEQSTSALVVHHPAARYFNT